MDEWSHTTNPPQSVTPGLNLNIEQTDAASAVVTGALLLGGFAIAAWMIGELFAP